MEYPTVREIVEKYLRENGYDGLFSSDPCCCSLDDLYPWSDCPYAECTAGYRIDPPPDLDLDEDEECDYWIGMKPTTRRRKRR